MNVTDLILNYIIEKSNNISPMVYKKAQECLIDYIGVTFAGAKENEEIIHGMCESVSEGSSIVLGTSIRTDKLKAAFLNGFNAHTMELDDGSRFGMIHLGAAIISPLIAIYEKEEILYKELLKGIIMGYEIAVRCSIAMQPGHKKRGFHTSGTCGTIGAAIAVASARNYNKEQLKSTISAAATSAAGLLEIQEDTSLLKPYNPGHAAMSGLMAAEIGKTAVIGPDDILGGKRGMFRLLSDDINEEFVSPQDYFEIERIYVKPYGACRHCHTAIEAVLDLRKKGIAADEIKDINVYTYKLAINGHDHKEIKGKGSAKLSIPYSVASAFILGKSDIETFEEKNITDSHILNLADNVNVFEEDEFTKKSSKKRIAKIEIVTENGKIYDRTIEYAKGDPENPMTYEEIIEKYFQMIEWSGNEERGEYILNKIQCEGERL